MKITKCKSCGAEIFFIEYKGKSHPINAKPRKVFIPEDAFSNSLFYWKPTAESDTIYWREIINGYESHFSTCPQAKDWRKKKLTTKEQPSAQGPSTRMWG